MPTPHAHAPCGLDPSGDARPGHASAPPQSPPESVAGPIRSRLAAGGGFPAGGHDGVLGDRPADDFVAGPVDGFGGGLEVSVEKSYPPFTLSVDFRLPASGITVVFGPSGAGKTTLLNIIAGLERPDSGRVAHRGRVLYDSSLGVRLPPERRGLGYVFQQPRLFSHLSVRSNLEFGPRFGGRPKREGALEGVVELLGIGHLLGRRPNTLSGGERQRVSIGRALMADPALLLMDEPLASLDRARKRELIEYVDRIPERLGVAVLYVTHAEDELGALADHVLKLEAGRGSLAGPPRSPTIIL